MTQKNKQTHHLDAKWNQTNGEKSDQVLLKPEVPKLLFQLTKPKNKTIKNSF